MNLQNVTMNINCLGWPREGAMGTTETPRKTGLPQIVKLDKGLKLVIFLYFEP